MAKQCEDCGRTNFDSAVTCAECGSLFLDMVGRLAPEEPLRDSAIEPPELELAAPILLEAPDTQSVRAELGVGAQVAPPAAFVRCADCNLVMENGPSRCKRCGSRRLDPVSGGASWSARQHARRGRGSPIEGEFPSIGLGEVVAFACASGLKLLIEIPLAVAILLSSVGPGGVGPTTYAWRYPLGVCLLASASTGAVGAYGLFYLERFGPICLSISFALDALLLFWLVAYMMRGEYFFWPGTGPYFFVALVCVVVATFAGRLATGNRLGSG
jgi:hypothetical protein